MSAPLGRLQWGDYIALRSSPADATGRTRWKLRGPGVDWSTCYLSPDEARVSLSARLRVAGLDYAEVPVAWAEMPPPPPPPPPPPRRQGQRWVRPGELPDAEIPAWAVTDLTRRLPACIIVACAGDRYARGLCWTHYDMVCQLGIKERVGLARREPRGSGR